MKRERETERERQRDRERDGMCVGVQGEGVSGFYVLANTHELENDVKV